MAQREVELILVRQLASHLTLPMLVVDPVGTLLYFNEAAEPLVGRRFEETDELDYDEWTALIGLGDLSGSTLPEDQRPLRRTLAGQRPAQGRVTLCHDGEHRTLVEVTAFPLVGQGGRVLGAVAMFAVVP